MKTKLFAVVSMLALAAAAAGAQSVDTKSCPPGTANSFGVPDQTRAVQDACQKAIDLFQFMMPQLAISLTGGNATLGSASTLGGIGHFSLGLRANAIRGDLPQFDNSNAPVVTGAQQTTYTTKSQIIGLPVADLAVGIFKGIPLGITNVGGLDAIVSASYLPAFHNGTVDVAVPNGSLKLGYGARLGILQESLLIPGVSVTYLRRDLPTVDLTSNFNKDTLAVNSFSVQTKAWRVVASKSLLVFGLAVGGGQETYNSSADVRASIDARPPLTNSRSSAGPVHLTQDLTRTNVFADLSLNIPLFKVVGEIGQVSGGTVGTFNQFSGNAADASRVYGSVGVRLGF